MKVTIKAVKLQYENYRHDTVTVYEVQKEDGTIGLWETTSWLPIGETKKLCSRNIVKWL